MKRAALHLSSVAFAISVASACDKETPAPEPVSETAKAEETAGGDEAEKSADGRADERPGLAGAKIGSAAVGAAAPSVPGLKTYKSKEHKFSVSTATLSPQIGPVTEKAPGITISGKSYMFPFKDRNTASAESAR